MPERATCTDAGFLSRFPGIEFLPHAVRLLAGGRPVTIEQLAIAAHVPADEVEVSLRGQPGTDWDERGRLVGFGLTSRPTAHRLIVSGQDLYTWCAMDTLFFPLILGEPAIAESRCPRSGQRIRVELEPGAVLSVNPESAVVSQVGGCRAKDVRREVCDHGHFFASDEAARDWLSEHADGRVVSVREALGQARRGCEALGWLAAEAAVR